MSDCGCVYFDEENGPDCFTRIERKARKEHRCVECRDIIQKGSRYVEETGIWEGSPERYRTCLDCISVREAFFCDGYQYEEMWTMLWEHLRDCSHTTPVEAISKLTPNARKDVCEMIEELWEKDDV